MQMEDKKSCFLRNVSSLWLNQEQISTSSLRKIYLTQSENKFSLSTDRYVFF